MKVIHTLISLGLFLFTGSLHAEWLIIDKLNNGEQAETSIAYTENSDAFTLEIYRDNVDAIRCRFSKKDERLQLPERSCPTYQIDNGMPINRSMNNAPCLSDNKWAEYILGYIKGGHIISPTLLAIMNGNKIKLRYRTANLDYRETEFSLLGSKRVMNSAFGEDISVSIR